MTAADLRARAAERMRVGWEICDAMTPTEMTNLAAELDRLRDCLGSIRATCNSGLREYDCPQCGCQTFALYEGYCHQCRDDNQRALDQHNAEHDRWQAMTDSQRDEAIRRASRA